MTNQSIVKIDLDKLNNKEPQEFSIMYKYFLPFVIYTAYFILGNIEDARDVAQEVFLKFWKSKMPKFLTEDKLRGYLYTAAFRQALNDIRNKKSKNSTLERYQNENIVNPTELQPIFVENLVLEQLFLEQLCNGMCESLNETEQKVLKYWIQGYSNKEIAEMIGKSPGRVANIKTELKEYFKKYPPGMFD